MARKTTAFRSRHPQRAALDTLRGRPKRLRRQPTAVALANERLLFYEIAELIEAGVFIDRCELVPEYDADAAKHRQELLW